MYCIVCSYVEPIEVRERKKLHCIISMEKDCVVQRISILGSYRPSTPRNHDCTPGYHDSMPGVPSEGTLLNVYTIKDKPQILYFNFFLIVNIMNNYFICFVRVKGHFMTLKRL